MLDYQSKDVDDDEFSKLVILEQSYTQLAHEMQSICGQSRETSVALTNLETSLLWAKNSITKKHV